MHGTGHDARAVCRCVPRVVAGEARLERVALVQGVLAARRVPEMVRWRAPKRLR